MRLVTVVGATGAQGGAVVRSLLETGKYKIRGLTRDANSAKALAVKQLSEHIEMVTCDINNKDDVLRAFRDSWAVFCVTDFWAQPDKPEVELKQGILMADAAVATKVEYSIFSVLEDSNKLSGNKLNVPHFSNKAKIRDYIKEKHPKLNAIYVEPGFYMQNWISSLKSSKSPDEVISFASPINSKTKLHFVDIEDTGPVVRAILQDPAKYVGQDICIAGEEASLEDLAKIFTDTTGRAAVAQTLTEAEFRAKNSFMPKIIQDELYDMFKWFEQYGYYGVGKDWTTGKKLVNLTSFAQWLTKTGWRVSEKAE